MPDKSTKQIRADFGSRLRNLISERGWNQSELARQATLHLPAGEEMRRDSVSVYVRGIALPKPKYLNAIAKALRVEVKELLPDRGLQVPDTPAEMMMTKMEDGRVWLQINQAVDFDDALKIMGILNSRKGK